MRPARALVLSIALPCLIAGGAPAAPDPKSPAGPVPTAGPAPTAAACMCETARKTGGWCEVHDVGWLAAVRIPSQELFDTLDAHGHPIAREALQCENCRKMFDTGGYCTEHKVGFVDGMTYFSRLTYELARGEPVDARAIDCPVCRGHASSHGWCDKCRRGMAGSISLRDREAYDAVEHALAVLEAAVRVLERCELCAVAMVTDTECPVCRITYKDGKPVPTEKPRTP